MKKLKKEKTNHERMSELINECFNERMNE